MKIHVIILAGGIGSRMNADRPKQFIEIDGVPVIVKNLYNFQRNNRIDGITVVCVKEWIPYFNELVLNYELTKVIDVIEGGSTGHDSTRNGVFHLMEN